MKKLSILPLALLACVGVVFAGGDTLELGSMKSKTPANWKKQEPSNKLRMAQYLVPKVDADKEDAELVVFFFGKGGGGSNDDNIKRWKGQFIAPEGKTIDEATKVEKFKLGDTTDVIYVDMNGTYKYKNPPFDPNAKEVRKDNFRRIGVIFDSVDGPFFITLTGPAKTMERTRPRSTAGSKVSVRFIRCLRLALARRNASADCQRPTHVSDRIHAAARPDRARTMRAARSRAIVVRTAARSVA